MVAGHPAKIRKENNPNSIERVTQSTKMRGPNKPVCQATRKPSPRLQRRSPYLAKTHLSTFRGWVGFLRASLHVSTHLSMFPYIRSTSNLCALWKTPFHQELRRVLRAPCRSHLISRSICTHGGTEKKDPVGLDVRCTHRLLLVAFSVWLRAPTWY